MSVRWAPVPSYVVAGLGNSGKKPFGSEIYVIIDLHAPIISVVQRPLEHEFALLRKGSIIVPYGKDDLIGPLRIPAFAKEESQVCTAHILDPCFALRIGSGAELVACDYSYEDFHG